MNKTASYSSTSLIQATTSQKSNPTERPSQKNQKKSGSNKQSKYGLINSTKSDIQQPSSKRSGSRKTNRPPDTRLSGTVISSNTYKRVETTGEKNSAAQVDILSISEHFPSGSVNIQTDAVSFEKKADDSKSYTTGGGDVGDQVFKVQRRQASFKSRSSKRSGGPSIPSSIYGQTQKQAQGSKNNKNNEINRDTLNVSLLQHSEQHPAKINAQIQRDNAMMKNIVNLGDSNLLIPGGGDSGTNQYSGMLLATPFPKPLQKQTTGRDDKKKKNEGESLLTPASDGLVLLPGFTIKRGHTKVENNQIDKQDSLDQSQILQGVTSLKSITRPSNVSGMGSVISPSSYHNPDGYSEGQTDSSRSGQMKPSVTFEQLDQITETQKTNISRQESAFKSQKSFKTQDGKTLVTVQSKIKILSPSKKKDKIDDASQNTSGSASKLQAKSNASSFKQKRPDMLRKNSKDSRSNSNNKDKNRDINKLEINKTPSKQRKNSISGNSSNKTRNSSKKLVKRLSSTSNSQKKIKKIASAKENNNDSEKSRSPGSKKSDNSPTGSPEPILSGGLKNLQFGLVSIDERQDEQQPDIVGAQEFDDVSPHPPKQPKQSNSNIFGSFDSRKSQQPPPADKKTKKKNLGEIKTLSQTQKRQIQAQIEQTKESINIGINPFQEETTQFLKQQIFAETFYNQVQETDSQSNKDQDSQEKSSQDGDIPAKELNSFTGSSQDLSDLSDKEKIKQEKLARLAKRQKSQRKMQLEKNALPATDQDPLKFKRQDRKNKLKEIIQTPEEIQKEKDQKKIKDLELQVEQLRDVMLKRQQDFQDEFLTKMSEPPPNTQQNKKTKSRSSAAGVSNNQGYIGQINQPVYNIKVYNKQLLASEQQYSIDSGSTSPKRQPTYHAMGKPETKNRPNSSNVYSGAQPGQSSNYGQKRRPMTAAGVGKQRQMANQQNNNLVDEQQMKQNQQVDLGGLQNIVSQIDFQIQQRPISAATYQKTNRAGRNNQRAMMNLTEGQVSQQALAQFLNKAGSTQFVSEKQNRNQFQPATNSSTQGVQRTKNCYQNVLNRKDLGDVIQSQTFVHSNALKTGYASVPNKSQKILNKAAIEQSKTLTKKEPLFLKTQPMKQLSGVVYKEMVSLHRQKNKNKHFYINRKNQSQKVIDGVSRHAKLKSQNASKNEDLVFSDIDNYMRENHQVSRRGTRNQRHRSARQKQLTISSSSSSDSNRDPNTTGMTGNKQILMIRNQMEYIYLKDHDGNRYYMNQIENNGEQTVEETNPLKLDDVHFQPIFFAENTTLLSKDITAQKALKKYRVYKRPEDVLATLKSQPLPKMNLGDDLEQKLEKKIEEDFAAFEKFKKMKKDRQLNPGIKRAHNLIEKDRQDDSDSQRLTDDEYQDNKDHKSRSRDRRIGGIISSQMSTPASKQKQSTRSQRLNMYRMSTAKSSNYNILTNSVPISSVVKANLQLDEIPELQSNNKVSFNKDLDEISSTGKRKSGAIVQPLSEKQKSLIERLSKAKIFPTRLIRKTRLMQEKSGIETGDLSVVLSPNGASSPKDTFTNNSPSMVENSNRIQVSRAKREQSLLSSSSDKSSNIFSSSLKGSPQIKLSKQEQSLQGSEQQKAFISQNSQVFRPFSASAGGGNYIVNQPALLNYQKSQREVVPERLKKSKTPKTIDEKPKVNQSTKDGMKTPKANNALNNGNIVEKGLMQEKSLGVFSNSTQTTKLGNNSRPPRNSKSILSADPIAMKWKKAVTQVQKINRSGNSKLMASSSDQNTSKSVFSNKSSVTTALARTKIISSAKDSETHTTSEVSDITARTKIEKVPSNINLKVNLPRATQKLFASEIQNSEYDQPITSPDVSAEGDKSLQNKNIEVSITPLGDSPIMSKDKFLQEQYLDSHIKDRRQPHVSVLSTESQKNSKERSSIEQLQFRGSSDLKDAKSGPITSPSLESKNPVLVGDSSSKSFDSIENLPLQQKKRSTTANKAKVVEQVKQSVPTLQITQVQNRQRKLSLLEQGSKQTELRQALGGLMQTTEKPNTDRVTLELINPDSSQTSRVRENLDTQTLNPALLVPHSGANRSRKQKMKMRQLTKDSQISIMTPMFQKDGKHEGLLAERQSGSISDFSFAAGREFMVDFKGSQGSNQSRHSHSRQHTKIDVNNLLSPTHTSQINEGSHTESQIDQLSETTSDDERQRRIGGDNIDLIELDADDGDEVQSDKDLSRKKAPVLINPMFKTAENSDK